MNGTHKKGYAEESDDFRSIESDDEDVELGKLEQFFGGVWNRMVFRCRYCIILLFIIWTVYAIDTALGFGPLTKREEYLPDDHPIIRSLVTIEDEFPAGENDGIQTFIYFGVKDIDKSEVSQWDPENLGEVEFDEKLDLSSIEAQKSLLNFC